MINVNIPSVRVNEVLSNIPVFAELQRFQNDVNNVAQQIAAAKVSVLGRTDGETINGLTSLTQNVDEYSIGSESIPGIITVTPSVPGYETTLTSTIGTSSDLGSITGGTVSNGSLNDIVLSNSPRSIKSVLSSITGITPEFAQVIADMVPDQLTEFAEDAFSAIDQVESSINTIVNNVNSAIANLNFSVNTAVGGSNINVLDNVSLNVDNYIEREVRKVTNNDIPDAVVSDVVSDLTVVKDPNRAIERVKPYSKVSVPVLEETISSIPASPSSNITPYSPSTDSFGTKSDKTKRVNPSSSDWRGKNTDLRTYEFTEVSSVEELVTEFRSMTRPITEFVAHWTANYINQGHIGARETHEVAINRSDFSFDGCSYHYIIKRDGTIERGRPVNIQGAHARGHNKYSIGISFVAGYNCPSGTPNPNRYVSAESITPAQMESFDKWLLAFYSVWPGGQAFGHNDTDPNRKVDPGFDVPEYVASKFGKRNVIAAIQGPLSPEQLVLIS